ncbi:MAG: acyl-[acyl-carrier-protein] thioesterase [Streptococcaceae bacterium]|jgi:medium-chain acyl-[acyl-carrier-protein] hydrolase|nr:acyl-[acyl-carrier-protein] thioesterase [Streptococcaceae bacterium]
MGKKYSTTFTVPFYMADSTQKLQISSALAVALEVSGKQSVALDRSDDWVFEHFNKVWIVTEYALSIVRLPHFKETVTIETEAVSYNKIFCYRDFWFYDADGNELLKIHSTWVLMDFDSRHVDKINEEIVAPYAATFDKKIERGHHFLSEQLTEKKPLTETLGVRYADIDSNQHVNNAVYIDYALSPLGFDFLSAHTPEKIDIKYNHEVRPDSNVEVSIYQDGLHTYHEINDKDCQLEIRWRHA